MTDYSLIVLGGGVAGYTGAIRAAKAGMKVAIFEREHLGGTCLNRGCIPTKTLLHSAELFSSAGAWAEMGILAENVRLDESAVYARKDALVEKLRAGIQTLMKANKIDVFTEAAEFASKDSVTAGGKTYTAEHFLIATGSSPAALPIPGIEHTVNSDRVLEKPLSGERITIIGGGVIGVEFASYFADAGRQVTVVEAEDRILPMLEKELSLQLAAVLKKKGITLKTGAVVERFVKTDAGVETHILVKEKPEIVPGDQVIVSVGRRANLTGLGLEKLGILTGRGIMTDERMHTGVGNIYAAGDVTARVQLAHYAAASATVAVEAMLGEPASVDLTTVPACVYTSPEIACVGLSEAECAARGLEVEVGKYLMGGNGKSMIEGADRGFIKTIVEKHTGRILGATAFCCRGTDILGELVLAVSQGIQREQLLRVIHAHPTTMEGVYESLEASAGRCIYTRN